MRWNLGVALASNALLFSRSSGAWRAMKGVGGESETHVVKTGSLPVNGDNQFTPLPGGLSVPRSVDDASIDSAIGVIEGLR